METCAPSEVLRSAGCLGLDVAKASFAAAWAPVPGAAVTSLPAAAFARTPEGVGELRAWLGTRCAATAGCVRVVMEATGVYSAELAAWLCEADAAFVPCIVNPQDAMHYRKSLGLRNNTDKLAAKALALMGVERKPKPYEPLPEERVALRALTRYRDHVVQQRVAFKNRLQEPAPSSWVRRREKAELKHLDTEVARVEKALHEYVKTHPALAHDVKLMMSAQGVGFLTAVVLLGEAGDLRRFTKARQLGAFAGLSPAHNDSGTSVHGRPRLCKKGNVRIRQALYLSALTTIRCDNDLARFYRRLCEAGKEPMVALAAVMRKLLLVLRAMLIADKPYDPNRQSGGQNCGKLHPNPEEN